MLLIAYDTAGTSKTRAAMEIAFCLAGGEPQHRYSSWPISCGIEAGSRDCPEGPLPVIIEYYSLK